MPQHDLEPPKFCRLALERILADWKLVKQIILFNSANRHLDNDTSNESFNYEFDEDSVYVDSQSGSVDLDKFIYIIVIKSPNEMLTLLAQTIKSNIYSNGLEGVRVAKRLVRSVARLFSIICVETSPTSLHLDLTFSTQEKSNHKAFSNSTNSNRNSLGK